MLVSPISAWLLHTERGDAGGVLAQLGGALPMPAYGLAMSGAASAAASIATLAAAYAEVHDLKCSRDL